MISRYAPWFAGEDALRPLLPLSWLFDAPARPVGPAVDILEKDDGLEILCDVPGSRPEDVSVTLENGVLTIHARRTVDHAGAAVHRAERHQGELTRAFTLGETYDGDSVSATLHNGVLAVKVAKRPEAAPRKIPVRFAADAADAQLGA